MGCPVYRYRRPSPATGNAQERVSPLPSITPARGSVAGSLLNTDTPVTPPAIDGGRKRGSHSVSGATGMLVVPPMEELGRRIPLLFQGKY